MTTPADTGRDRRFSGAGEGPDAWWSGRVPEAHLPHGHVEASRGPLHWRGSHRDHSYRSGKLSLSSFVSTYLVGFCNHGLNEREIRETVPPPFSHAMNLELK